MSSGRASARGKSWVLAFAANTPHYKNALTGWNSQDGTNAQVRLQFTSLEEAQAYAKAHGIEARVVPAREHARVAKSYADNFRHTRFAE